MEKLKMKIMYGHKIIRPQNAVSIYNEPETKFEIVKNYFSQVIDLLTLPMVIVGMTFLVYYQKFDPNAFMIGFMIGIVRGIR